MTDQNPPPRLEDLLEEAQGIEKNLKHLEILADLSKVSSPLKEAIKKIELHIAAQRALFDAGHSAYDAADQAQALFRKYNDEAGTGAAMFHLMQGLRELGDKLAKRLDHEAKRETGDFR